MKIKCSRVALHEAFSVAAMVVPQRTTIPAITNVKLSALQQGKAGGCVELACTDLEFGLTYRVPAEVKDEGTVVLPVARMAGILRESGDEEISIDSDGPLAHVRTSDSDFKVVGIDPAYFPTIPAFEDRGAVQIAIADLGDMIRKTQFAVSTEAVRYALTGQLLELRGKEIRVVASDGKRLAFIKNRASGKGEGKDVRVIVPTKTMNLLDKVFSDEDETVALNVEETQIRFRTKRAVIFSRLIEGNFPDYDAVIPTDRDKKIPLEREKFLSAVRKASLMTTDKARAVKFDFRKGKLILFTRAQDVGEARVEMPIAYSGEEIDVVFNPDYVADFLKASGEEAVELQLKDKTTAGLFRSGKEYLYVLMPLTVSL
ncbi:MAG: DNA polymerase III subunit beta [Planctomycetes bacterium]|nr:DNA polymerase III subunit beta [Planctomycetota bacterium]